MLNKVVFLLLILITSSVQANIRFCSNSAVINSFLSTLDGTKEFSTDLINNCAKMSHKSNLGFKDSNKVAFILDNEINDKVFYFSFPMIHEISFYKFEKNRLIETRTYSKNNNQGKEYIYFDNIGRYSNTIIAVTNTQNSIQFPYILFDSRDEFQSFLKKKWMFDGLWFGVIFTTLLLTFALYHIRNKLEIIYYSMHIFALFIIQMAFSGYLFSYFNYLPQYFLSRAVVLACSVLTFGTVGLIYKTFLDQRPTDIPIKIYGAVKALAAIHLISSLLFYNQVIIKSTSYLTLILSLSSILICLYAMTRRLKYSGSFLLSFSLFLFSSLAFTLKDLGVMNINEIQVNYLVKLSLLVEIFILGTVLVRRLLEEAKIITNASMHQMITKGNIKIIKKLQHDIDSPLTSLEYFIMEVKNTISEDLRLMGRQSLNRIQDIINTLKINEEDSILEENSKKEILAIYPILKRIVSEKRIEYKSRTDVLITLESDFKKDHFVEIKKSDFYRAISNIINNSIEAKKLDTPISVNVKLENIASQIQISISDNGVGIDSKYINEIFNYGKSFNKISSGIGLNQAKDYIESEAGNITIQSTLNEGTIIKIVLNETEAPIWYSEKINLSSKKIVIIDDDQSIHNLWNEKLISLTGDITHLYSSEEFEQWANSKNLTDYYFLVDLEFIDSIDTGINLINAYKLHKHSLLVTSHFMNSEVQNLCTRFGIKMIPKESVLNIPVNLSSDKTPRKIVLIDDDRFTHLNWKRAVQNNGIELFSFYNVKEFLHESSHLDFDTPIYIDSNLGHGQKGEVLSKKIYEKGFKNITLATGARKEDIEVPFWITKVQGKGFFV